MPQTGKTQDSPIEREAAALKGGRVGVIAWHVGWAVVCLLSVVGPLLVAHDLSAVAALGVMAIPGIASTLLLWRDTPAMRRFLIVVWAIGAMVATGLTGGIGGPLAVWCATPLLAAVVLNQRALISLGGALSVLALLTSALVSLLGNGGPVEAFERLWLSLVAMFSVVVGLSVALLPALRVRAEQANDAEDARQKLLAMLTEQPCLLICLNEGGRLLSAYGEGPPGIDLRVLMQLGLSAAAHLPDRLIVRNLLETAVREGRADGGFIPHAAIDRYVAVSLRRGADGRLYGMLRDASVQHAHEIVLEAAREEAESLNAGKTRFVASMSHELRTPLNAVIGFSDVMRQKLFGELPPRYAEYAQLIWESGQHVLDLVNDILDMSKIEAQKYEVSIESFDVREPVSQALRLVRGQANDKGLEIVSLLPPAALPLNSDRRAIKQICLNLLSNAIKFTPRGGSVTLEMKRVDEGVSIQVRDTGIGIAPEDLKRIGEPYAQGGSAEQRAMGTGLGLSIVQAMTQMLGGQMDIASVLGEGTSVTVIIPPGQSANDAEQPSLPLDDDNSGAVVQSLDAFVRAAAHPAEAPREAGRWTPDSGFGEFVVRPPGR